MFAKKLSLLILLLVLVPAIVKAQKKEFAPDSATNVLVFPLDFNSNADEYAATISNNTLIYCSNSQKGFIPYYSTQTGKPLEHLFIRTIKNTNIFGGEKLLLKNIPIKSVQGSATFSSDGNKLFFTSSGILSKDENGELKIYQATYIDGEWKDFTPFAYNNKKYALAQPSLSSNGLTLYFASNMPGGYGGTDLYVSTFKNGHWQKPKNLGAKVNSNKNELFPYISKEGILYFSSDGLRGLGKLDIFSAKFIDSTWQSVKNMGKPYNSKEDDFAYFEDPSSFSGFFSSSRKTGIDADIFRFEKKQPDCDTLTPFPYCYTFYEEGTLKSESLPLVYEWDFGDGKTKRGLEVDHCFDRPGIYKINLNIIDTITKKVYFNEASYEMDVVPLNKAHIELSGIPSTSSELYLSAEKSHLNNCIINDYLWDFGDGQSAEGVTTQHTYQARGEYEIKLLVKGKSASTGSSCQACVSRKVTIGENPIPLYKADSAQAIEEVAQVLHTVKNKHDIIYKVQVTTSKSPLKIDSANFKGLQDVKEYKDEELFAYAVGEEKDLSSAYPLYANIRERGFEDAKVVAFKNGKIISGNDISRFKKASNKEAFTTISGRIINRYGEPLKAEIILENLSNGKVITKIISDSLDGRFRIILPNDEIYGFFAELEGYYSVSNFIDLRKEKRSLEMKKNIEMVKIEELNEENLSIRLNNLFFDPDEYHLKKESFPELNRLAKLLKEDSNVKIEISGHTDNTGGVEANMFLSKKRADAVKNYLIFMGIQKDKIISIGYGDTRPLVTNNTERGRYLNRRVEFRLFTN